MRFSLIAAIFILALACGFQFWLSSAGIFINLILATLIACAFFFDFLELAAFILFAIFVVNWQPAFSIEIALFVALPLAAHAFHKLFAWAAWAGIPAAIACGLIVLYLLVAPGMLLAGWWLLLIDMIGSLLFGEMVMIILERLARNN